MWICVRASSCTQMDTKQQMDNWDDLQKETVVKRRKTYFAF